MMKTIFGGAVDRIAAAAIAGLGPALPAAAIASTQTATAPVYGMTPERMAASTAAVIALLGVVIGGLAVVRSVRRIGNHGQRGAIVALVLGPIGLAIGGLVVATADGGVGTGNGVAGGRIAIALGLIGMALGWLALVRARRLTSSGS